MCMGCKAHRCWQCSLNIKFSKDCKDYNPFSCPKLAKPPYVCNACPKKQTCHESKRYYRAKSAQKSYESTLTNSRSGINMTPEELEELNALISPLVLKGQPLSHIFAVHSDEIPVCRRTLYNYLDQRVFTAKNIDLPGGFAIKNVKSAQIRGLQISSRCTATNGPTSTSRNIQMLSRNLTLSKWIL